jgi:hypothetical protein
MAPTGEFELSIVTDPAAGSELVGLLLTDEEFALVVHAVLHSVLGETALPVTHGLEHVLVDDLATPQILLLLLHLLRTTVLVTQVRQGLVQLYLHLGSRIGEEVGRLSLDSPVFVFPWLLLLRLLLLDVRVG